MRFSQEDVEKISGELLLVQLASVEAVLDLLQIQKEGIVGHAVMVEKPFFSIGLESFYAVDRNGPLDVTPLPDG